MPLDPEYLLKDIDRICQRLGVKYDPQILRKLKSAHRRRDILLRDYFSKKSVDIVANTYRFELNKFDYFIPF
jgi:hypothetical protein